jgi:CheY-like chemotaxis protein
VLVVDDEPLVASSVARVLGHRCAVEAVTDARGALERLAASRFDVILCDLMMPNFSGAEFYRVLSATSPALAARTVFLTGGAFTPDAEAFLERERPPVLAKPFEPDQLRLAVAAALGGCREDAAA